MPPLVERKEERDYSMLKDLKLNNQSTKAFTRLSIMVYVVVTISAINAVLFVSRLEMLSWTASAMLAFSAAVLTVGALFTAVEMHRLHTQI